MNGISCHFENNFDDTNITDEIKIDLFRICQEALTNIMVHAEASQVTVSLGEVEGRIRLTILDDGKGFVVDQQKRKPGLVRMRERAASINGQLTIQSQSGQGTMICVTI